MSITNVILSTMLFGGTLLAAPSVEVEAANLTLLERRGPPHCETGHDCHMTLDVAGRGPQLYKNGESGCIEVPEGFSSVDVSSVGEAYVTVWTDLGCKGAKKSYNPPCNKDEVDTDGPTPGVCVFDNTDNAKYHSYATYAVCHDTFSDDCINA